VVLIFVPVIGYFALEWALAIPAAFYAAASVRALADALQRKGIPLALAWAASAGALGFNLCVYTALLQGKLAALAWTQA
jgi:pyrrolidone-carboxylate peptidase